MKTVEDYINLGSEHSNRGSDDLAEVCFRRALKMDPEHPIALYNMGVMMHDKGELDKALDYYNQALDQDHTLSDAYYNIATIYQERKQYKFCNANFAYYNYYSRLVGR